MQARHRQRGWPALPGNSSATDEQHWRQYRGATTIKHVSSAAPRMRPHRYGSSPQNRNENVELRSDCGVPGVQIGAISCINFSQQHPYNFAATCSTRVSSVHASSARR